MTNFCPCFIAGGKPEQPRYHRYDSTCYLKIVLAIYNQSNGILLQEEGESEVKFLEKLKTLSGGQIPPKKKEERRDLQRPRKTDSSTQKSYKYT